jgi:hypothetical protein
MRPEHWIYAIPLRLRSLFRWAQADQELDDEVLVSRRPCLSLRFSAWE